MEKTLQGPSQIHWWKGARGKWYVVAQAVLGVLVIFGPRTCNRWPAWGHPCPENSRPSLAAAHRSVTATGGNIFIRRGAACSMRNYSDISAIAGVVLFLIRALLFAAGILKLGPNLTAVPFPKDEATLVETGMYGLVRHPMYSGAVMMALGWALVMHGWLTIGYAIALFLFFDVKSRQEEKWLRGKFSGYESYQRRVRKLIPYIY